MANPKWAFEDLEEGMTVELGEKTVSAEEIIEFASEFDPQPMHLDAAAGEASLLGGLAASGWHSCGIFMRLLCDGFLLQSTSQGGPGVEHLRWKRPLLAGDRVSARATVLSKRESKSRPTLGFATFRNELVNQRGELVMELENTGMFLKRAGLA